MIANAVVLIGLGIYGYVTSGSPTALIAPGIGVILLILSIPVKKENKTGVKVEIRDILTDKKNLIFKKKPEAKIEVKAKDKKLFFQHKLSQ